MTQSSKRGTKLPSALQTSERTFSTEKTGKPVRSMMVDGWIMLDNCITDYKRITHLAQSAGQFQTYVSSYNIIQHNIMHMHTSHQGSTRGA